MTSTKRMKYNPIWLISIAVLVLFHGCTQHAVITGKVVDNFDQPISNAKVEIVGMAFSSTTDQSGMYRIGYVPGQIALRITHPTHTSKTVSYNIATVAEFPAATIKLLAIPSPVDVEAMLKNFLNGLSRYNDLIGNVRFTDFFIIKSLSDTQIVPEEGQYKVITLVNYANGQRFFWGQGSGNQPIAMQLYNDVLAGVPPGQYVQGYRFARKLYVTVVPPGETKMANITSMAAEIAAVPAFAADEPLAPTSAPVGEFARLIVGTWKVREGTFSIQYTGDGTSIERGAGPDSRSKWQVDGDSLTYIFPNNRTNKKTIGSLNSRELLIRERDGSEVYFDRIPDIAQSAATKAINDAETVGQGQNTNSSWERPGTAEAAKRDRADAELNQVYEQVMNSLNEQQQKQLRSEELAWIKWRDTEAARIAHSTAEGGSAYRVDFLNAMTDLIQKRTIALKQRQK